MKYLRKFIVSAIALGAGSVPAAAMSDNWQIDPSRSEIDFALSSFTFAKTDGVFTKISGSARYNGQAFSDSEVEASVDVASINTKNQKRDEHLRTKDFFFVSKYPVATFKSSKVGPEERNAFKLTGVLTMHGISKEIVLNAVRETESANDVAFSATAVLNRKDFKIDYGPGPLIGDKVNLKLKLHLIHEAGDKN